MASTHFTDQVVLFPFLFVFIMLRHGILVRRKVVSNPLAALVTSLSMTARYQSFLRVSITNNDLIVTALNYQSRDPLVKTT